MRQLKAHVALLCKSFKIQPSDIGQVLVWPFLESKTSTGSRRFEEEEHKAKHVFKEECDDAEEFSKYLNDYLGKLPALKEGDWEEVLKWFTLLGCGAVVDTMVGKMVEHVILLSSEQLNIVHSVPNDHEDPLVIHGTAGSGKTLLILIKITQLWQGKLLHEGRRCVVLTGRGADGLSQLITKYLKEKGISNVTVQPLSADHKAFKTWCEENSNTFTHIFLDSAEDLGYLGSDVPEQIENLKKTRKHAENGTFWFMVDRKQVIYNLALHERRCIANTTHASLTKSYRMTQNIFNFTYKCVGELDGVQELGQQPCECFKASSPVKPYISVENTVLGPDVYVVDQDKCVSSEETVFKLLIYFFGKRGFKPNDLVVLCFNEFDVSVLNKGLELYCNDTLYIPKGVDMTTFQKDRNDAYFCITDIFHFKGMEGKIVVALPSMHKHISRHMRERVLYSMTSRCLCLLYIVWNREPLASAIEFDLNTSEPHVSSVQQHFQTAQEIQVGENRHRRNAEERYQMFYTSLKKGDVKAITMAKNGFVYEPHGDVNKDEVMCVYCGGIPYFKGSDNVTVEGHRYFCRNFPVC